MTLYKNILLILASFAFSTSSLAQTKTDQIRVIRKEFQAINTDATLNKVTLENEEFLEHMTDGGGKLSGYYKQGEIKKIHRWIGLSNGIEIMEFYFQSGELIFVYEKFNSFVYDQKKEQFDFAKTETTFEGRYYFNNKKLIDYVTTGHNRFEDDGIDPEKTLTKEAADNLKLLNKKN
jgi:hypothetical protein